MAGNGPTADIRRWDRLSPQWEVLNQLEILILLGQHFDIDQVPGMNDMYGNWKKNTKKLKAYDESCFSRDFYSGIVLYTAVSWLEAFPE